MWSQRIALAAVVVTVALLNMALWAGGSVRPTPHVAYRGSAAARQPGDPVSGVWVGRWKADVEPGEGKSLMCEIVQIDDHAWKATFNAVCDKDYAFTMEVPGRREGDDILFEASVDLGRQYGGIYHWTGQVVDDQFSGVYTHARYNGTFQMKYSPGGVIEPGVYCKVPPTTGVEGVESGIGNRE